MNPRMKFLLKTMQGVALLAACAATSASTLTPYLDSNIIYIKLEGRIEEGDPYRLMQVLNTSKAKNFKVWGLILKSPGGSVEAGLQLASIVRQNGLSTHVSANDICASACFYPFAAGVYRWADTNARVGVHSAAENGRETDRATAATIRFSRVLATLDVPDAILGKIVKTPPEKTYFLTPQDLASMGVQFIPTPASKIQNILADAGMSAQKIRDPIQDRKRARELNQLGLDELRDGRIEKAVATLTEAATLYPFDAEILGNLGYAQYLQGIHDAALGTLLTALKVQPTRAATLQNLGLVYAELGKSTQAAQYFLAYVKAAKNTQVALDTLQKWAVDTTRPERAQAALLAVNSLNDPSM
ncbi:Predicted O-linked N-acetylglucosamine transferase%2C SPINDLY family [Bordetella ansorpii]|uniref:Predicted O-linked N-acetylglucosamine transferase, SPINDLY family n=2 Tax=Betaproteobacteria TaxID=28216 RepID=A0A157SDR3_9BORD|nr:hypothetical protein CTYAZ2_45600 [Comamonas testosteroni]CAB3877901.1 hypothetical protein LMG3412_03099 [Achromobacter deleyi]SAI68509.1 Predicted O-linked N-acetylglucosamine transferase%2C SPINDLY family [Bordetella ansorpii]